MLRKEYDFAEFKEHFINQPDGYFPVYSEFREDQDGNYVKILKIDLICEWRLSDGKILFIQVPFETKEQFNEIIEYLKIAANILNKKIMKRIDELLFPDVNV